MTKRNMKHVRHQYDKIHNRFASQRLIHRDEWAIHDKDKYIAMLC